MKSVTERAKLLRHSVDTNLKHYSYSRKDSLDYLRDTLNNKQSA